MMTKKPKYFSLADIDKVKSQYKIIFGQRSNGKTWAVLEKILKNYKENKKQGALIRRYLDDIMPSKISTIFNAMIKEGIIAKIFDNEWDTIRYAHRKFYLARSGLDSKGNPKVTLDENPVIFVFALTEEEDYKENSYPDVTTIFFDEFLSRRGYIYEEFITFENLISTIKRGRDDVTIYMVGNTINQYCPYFTEMGIKNVAKIPVGKIEVYTYGDSDLRVAVQRAENITKINSKKDIDQYFAFDNPKLRMITSGEWELDIYPHCPFKYLPKEIKDIYFIKFDEAIYQCEIICHEREWITFIHRKSTPIKDEEKDIVFQEDPSWKSNIRTDISKPYDDIGQRIWSFFTMNRVFYQDNEVGEAVSNYIRNCQSRK